MFQMESGFRLSDREIKYIIHDAEKSAKVVQLHYVSDSGPGISRIRTKNGFEYRKNGKKIINAACLQRIRSLVIPPAWENVWICEKENGHLQATGVDIKGRKQYRYHPLWNTLRNQTKFYRLQTIGKALPLVRKKLNEHLSLPGLSHEKVLAAVVSIMEMTSIRTGNNLYERLYGSFGITTLKDHHVKFNKGSIQFLFRGKKGVRQNINLNDKRLSRIIKQCRDIPGKELFQYYTDKGEHKRVDSGMVNSYLKEISGDNITAKDLRTWSGTVKALAAFKTMEPGRTVAETKRNIVKALDNVAGHLGNTRTVCKKYYVHPLIISLYENGTLHAYFRKIHRCRDFDLNCDEKVLMRILKNKHAKKVTGTFFQRPDTD